MKTIVVEGQFTDARGFSFWGMNLSLPLSYRMTCEVDENIQDEEPNDSTIGIYETASGYITLSFGEFYETGVGDYLISQPATRVRVLNHHQFTPGGIALSGISWGNDEEFEAHTLYFGEYTGLYANLIVPSSYSGVTITSDALHWLWDSTDNETLRTNSYLELFALDGETEVSLKQTGFSYTVQ